MPGGDRTGPLGQGPMTGRGLGYCGGYADPGYWSGWGGGRGMAWGRGGGRGWGRGGFWTAPRGAGMMGSFPYAAPSPIVSRSAQALALQSQAEQLKAMLSQIEEEIRDLEEAGSAD